MAARLLLDPHSAPLRILLLEDSDIDAELVEAHLAAGTVPFELSRATTREAFENLLETVPDVILADYSLPGFDGLMALALTNQRQPQIPFIFVSGVVGEEFATRALQEGAVDYVTKRNLRRLRGAVSRAVAEARERDRRQQVEAELRASEAASRIALRAARLGGWDFSPPTQLLTWDARCRQMFGVSDDTEITYDVFLAMLHPDDRERIHLAIQLAITQWSHSEFIEQFRITTANGEMLWIESTGNAIFENGVCQRFVGVIRDITSEKRAELAMLDRAAYLEASVEQQSVERLMLWRNSQDLLAVLGRDGRVRDMTPSWHRLLGAPVSDVIGRYLMDFAHPDDKLAMLDRLEVAKPLQFDSRLRHADGSYRWFSWTASPDDAGTIYANGRDITDEKASAAKLAEVEETLRQSQKMEAIGQLTGGIAHDFNNLLAGIIGSIDVIGRRLKKQRYDDLDRFLEAATVSAQRAASLTQRLLAFSRRQSLDVRSEDVGAIITSMDELLRGTLGENVALSIEAKPGLWRGLTDSNQLENAVLNLAINARDAMSDGGTLTISGSNFNPGRSKRHVRGLEQGDYVLVTVADTGEGMAEDVIAKAFDPFFTTKPIGQGTGLGLSMVYGFVKQSGGHVNIVSRKGEGTRIELYLKRAESAETTASPDTSVPHRPTQGEVVLVVEDDPAVRMLILEVIKDLGYDSIEAQDAPSALPHLQSDARIDLLVSDVGLPGITGRELADLARQQRPDLPILFVTGYAEGAEHREGYLGTDMKMLAKPFRSDELASSIHTMLGGDA
ncbi:MAG: response regulator [Candidatus Devosia phytovorans]|uniref:histidine kinase n=1 Tax=Candidatus Devosia phytovorans TaxID=3121372 RepID=A0AAJ5VX99_9HYPH|nr:response regulator [Devosia sp.]WEK06087.1 MAG: response regulator [Devosia sp.]